MRPSFRDGRRGEGLEAELLGARPDRPSVLVRARGSGGGRTLLLCGHLDTVGSYEDAVAEAETAGAEPGTATLADVGVGEGPGTWVIEGYATLFAELGPPVDIVIVPVGVGSLAAAASRFGAHAAPPMRVVGVEPVTAACLTVSLAAGDPTTIDAPGTIMAGLNCAEVSPAAWPTLRAGMAGMVTVTDDEARAAMGELPGIGESGAAPLAALRALATEHECAELRAAIGLGVTSRVVLIVTDGLTSGE